MRNLLALFLVLQAAPALAASWDVNYRNLSQVRKDRTLTYRDPMYQYMGFGFSELPQGLSFRTDFMVYTDPTRPAKNFDLYQADIHIEPADRFTIDGGRLWQVDGFEAGLIDGMRLSLFPESSKIGGTLFGGIPRYLEDGNFHEVREGLDAGFNLNLREVKDTALQFSARWKKVDVTRTSWDLNDTIVVGLVGSHQFSDAWAQPNLYGNVEFDIAGRTFDVATLGLDLYPHWRVAVTLEGNRFNVNRRSNQRTILGTYFSEAINQGVEAMQIKIAKNLHFVQDFSYQRYSVPGRSGQNGYTAGAGLDLFWDKAKLSALGQYYFRQSFGGRVQGGYAHFSDRYFKKWLFEAGVDISRYSKITGQRGTAASVTGDVAYLFNDRCRFSLGGEFNHNNWFDREGRVTVNLELGFDKSDYHPEKRSKRVNRRFHEI